MSDILAVEGSGAFASREGTLKWSLSAYEYNISNGCLWTEGEVISMCAETVITFPELATKM